MSIKIGINGFGRIGRMVLRSIIENNIKDLDVVAINNRSNSEISSFLLKHDTIHGELKTKIKHSEEAIEINGKKISIINETEVSKIDWKKHDVNVVLECTGKFNTKEKSSLHIKSGAKKVLVSAPCKGATNVVFGVNQKILKKTDQIISAASCTTNCLAPIAKVLNDEYEIEEGLMTTVHATTATQFTVDGPSKKDFRGGRSSLLNIMPASTGAAKAVTKVIPSLEGKLTGMAFRVPTANVSVVDLTVKLKKETSYDEIKKTMKNASEGYLKNILGYCEEPVVSQDFIGDVRTSVFDAGAGMELNSKFYKIIAWYDNECGYSNKLIDLANYISKL